MDHWTEGIAYKLSRNSREKYKRIGDIMKRFTPFLKLYTEYVKNFENAISLVDSWEEKSNKFAALLKEIKVSLLQHIESSSFGNFYTILHVILWTLLLCSLHIENS